MERVFDIPAAKIEAPPPSIFGAGKSRNPPIFVLRSRISKHILLLHFSATKIEEPPYAPSPDPKIKKNPHLRSSERRLARRSQWAPWCLFGGTSKAYPMYLSNPKPGHTTGGSGRGGAWRGSRASRGRARGDADMPVRPIDSRPFLPSRASKTIVVNDFSEARTNEILCKPTEKQNPRLTSGSSAVYQRDGKRSSFLAVDHCTVAHVSL